MSTELIKYAFIAGEVSPTLFGRTDLTKYDLGMALAYNWFVDYRGGLTTRPGTEFLDYIKHDHLEVKLMEFQFSPDLSNTYVLMFGHGYIRFIQDGAYVLEGAKAISNITTTGGRVFVTSAGHGYSSGQWIKIAGVNGIRDLNGRSFNISVVDANSFEILDPRNDAWINRNGEGYLSGGTVARIYEIGTTYDTTHLEDLKGSQIRDLIRLTHPDHPIRNLRRFGHTNWTLTDEGIGGPSFSAGTWGLSINAHNTGTAKMSVVYAVSAIMADGAESTATAPAQVIGATNFSIEAGTVKLTWNVIPGATEYIIYRSIIVPDLANGAYAEPGNQLGFIGRTTVNTFTDSNIVPDFTKGPVESYNPFAGGAGFYPSISTVFQQRQIYAASYQYPMTFWASQVKRFNNFDGSAFTVDSDSYEFEVDASQVAPLLHFKSLRGGLLMFSQVGIWLLTGGGNSAAVTPSNALADPQSYTGVSGVPPIQIGSDLLYIEGKGYSTRLLSYNDFSKVYSGEDKSILSNHLFGKFKQIVSWTFAENPYKMVIACRSDGAALFFTTVKEQDVYAWTWGQTKGWFKSALCISESGNDVPYVIVERVIQGALVKYLERFVIEEWNHIEDSFCVDSGLRYEPALQAGTLGISEEYDEGDKIFVNMTGLSGASFTGKLGWWVRSAGGVFIIREVVSATVAKAEVLEPATELVPGYPNRRVAWNKQWYSSAGVKEFTGLQHLEGEVVSILGDGNVFTPQQVVNGKITLSDAVSKARVGLGYRCVAQTLPPTVPDMPIEARRKRMVAIATRLYRSRGLLVGRTEEELYPMRERTNEGYGIRTEMINGMKYQLISTDWNEDTQAFFVQEDPLPASILGLIPDLEVGDDTN
jgi:hypothetical protein